VATYAPQVLGLTGVAPTYNAATATDVIAPTVAGQRYVIHIKNGNASATSFVVDDPTSPTPGLAGSFNPDATQSVPATSERIMIIDASRFKDTTGNINVTFSVTATVTYAIYGPL
jgi:hypothetical protein